MLVVASQADLNPCKTGTYDLQGRMLIGPSIVTWAGDQ